MISCIFQSQFHKNLFFVFFIALSFIGRIEADAWRIMSGSARDIAIGANGQIWAIGTTPADGSFAILKWNGTLWETIDGGGSRIAVDPKGVPWVVNQTGQIWKRDGSRWISMSAPGAASDIGIGANGDVWIVTREATTGGNKIQFRNSNSWTYADGAAVRISVGPNGSPWIVNSSGQIAERKNGRWESRPGSATDIGVGANGVVWVIGNNPAGGGSYGVHRWNGSSRWEAVDGGGTQIAVDHFGRPLITNHLNEIYRREYTPSVFSRTPTVSAITMNYRAGAGRVSAIAINPVNPDHVIIAGESGGLFETLNARSDGRTWTHLSAFDEYAVSDILILPLADGKSEVYVTCSDSYKNLHSAIPLVYKREAVGSRSWTRVGFTGTSVPSDQQAAHRIVKSKTNNTLYAGGVFGVAMQADGSQQWRVMGRPPGSGIAALETMADNTLVAGMIGSGRIGVYYSTDNGVTWYQAACPVPLPSFPNPLAQSFSLKADPSGRVVCISRYNGTGVQLYVSTDSGRNWSLLPTTWGTVRVSGNAVGGYESITPLYNSSRSRLELYLSNGENVYYGYSAGSTLQEAVDNAMNNRVFPWQPGSGFNRGVGFNAGHEDTRHIAFLDGTPKKMLITSDGGISIQNITGDNPETFSWTLENPASGFNALQIYNMTGNGSELFFGTQDNAYGYNRAGDARIWEAGGGREGYFISNQGCGYDNTWNIYGLGGSYGKMTGAFNPVNDCGPSGNAGRWNSPTTGQGTPIWFGSGIYVQDDGRTATGSFRWKISDDNGCTWESLPDAAYPRVDVNSYFSSSETSPFHLYVPMSRNGTTVLGRLVNPLNRDVTNIWQYPLMSGLEGGIARVGSNFLFNPVMAVNPANPFHLLACEASTGKLKISQTGGNNWTEVTAFQEAYVERGRYSLKNLSGTVGIWSIEFSPYDPQLVLLGTVARGLFISKDGGSTWTRLNMEGVYMPTDFYWKTPLEVIVSTYGRGMFRINL